MGRSACPGTQHQHHMKLAMVVHACNLNIVEIDVGRSIN